MDMDHGVKGWLYNTVRLNFWRVAGWYEFDDLVQDGFMHYQRIVNKYQNVREPKHIMALFKTAFTNHIHDLSKKRTRYEFEQNESDLNIDITNLDDAIQLPDTSLVLATLPPIMLQFIRALQENPEQVRAQHRIYPDHRETTNEKMCKLIGADPREINLLETLRSLISGVPDPAV